MLTFNPSISRFSNDLIIGLIIQIQEDIATLRLVLNDKLKRENELKQLLGVSFVEEIKHDFTEGINQIRSTSA